MMTSPNVRPILLLFALIAWNVPPAVAQGRSVTRLEQDDPSIVYSGNWYSNTGEPNSGGTAALTNTRGARVTVTFTGTGITWLGLVDRWSGLGTVHLDGTLKILDTYSELQHYQHVQYSATGLAPGPHTLSIEVLHERGPKTSGSWVWIDAFDIENGAGLPGGITADGGRIEQNNPALVFTGSWFSHNSPAHSGGSAVLATDVGSRATIHFNGTGISWVAHRDEWSGIARVYLDGEPKAEIDNYLSPQLHTVVYNIGGLPFGKHTLTIEVTGIRAASSRGSWIWLDAFDVVQ